MREPQKEDLAPFRLPTTPPVSPYQQGGRLRSDWVVAFDRNGWPLSVGIDGRVASDSAPIDISGEFLRVSAKTLAANFPKVVVAPVEADFSRAVGIPTIAGSAPRLGFFPGSTIGNSTPFEAVDLLREMGRTLNANSMLLVGIDLIKDKRLLVPAYDNSQGTTAEFNLNLLRRINRELGGDIPVEAFRHVARWNDAEARMEMHLEAKRGLTFDVGPASFHMRAGETIHTECSYKYNSRSARLLLRAGGWAPIAQWTDAEELFTIILAEAAAKCSVAPR